MTPGLSKRGLDRLHSALARHVADDAVPGYVAMVSRGGDVDVDVAGVQQRGRSAPMQRDSIFRISSMTKPVTAVAAMILVEECALRLDDPVDELLPELAGRRVLSRLDGPLDDTVPAHRAITTRDLLTFRMGMGLVFAMPGTHPIQVAMDELALGQGPPSPAATPPPDEWMRRLGTLPLMHQPGEVWMYNTGSDVLGVLIARAAGQPFETFLRERIFDPLGMTDTGFSVPPSSIDRLVTGYGADFATGSVVVYDEAAGGQWSLPPAFPGGGAGLVSTIDDYHAFGRMLLDGGSFGSGSVGAGRIVSRSSVEAMTTDQLTAAQKATAAFVPGFFDGTGWGFGVAVTTRRDGPASVPGQFGWDGGLGTSWRTDPAEQLVGVLLTQQAFSSPLPPPIHRDFWTTAYAALDD